MERYGALIGIGIVAAVAYRAIIVNQELAYDYEYDRKVKKYRKPNISGQRKIVYVQGRAKEDSYFGLPSWNIMFGDGTTQIVYSDKFPNNYVKDYS